MFKDKIRMLRMSRRMSQYALAAAVGVTQGSVSHWENGRAFPEMPVLKALCAHFDVSMDELMDGDTMPSENGNDTKIEYVFMTRDGEPISPEKREKAMKIISMLMDLDDEALDQAGQVIDIYHKK